MSQSNAIRDVDIYARLNASVKEAGSQSAFARKIGVSVPFLNMVVNAERHPSDRILAAIGIRRVVETHYEFIEGA